MSRVADGVAQGNREVGEPNAMTVAARLTQAAASFALEAFGPIESNTSAAQPGSNTKRRLVLHAVAQWPAVHMKCVAGTADTATLFLRCTASRSEKDARLTADQLV